MLLQHKGYADKDTGCDGEYDADGLVDGGSGGGVAADAAGAGVELVEVEEVGGAHGGGSDGVVPGRGRQVGAGLLRSPRSATSDCECAATRTAEGAGF